jgi:hypothetical protein
MIDAFLAPTSVVPLISSHQEALFASAVIGADNGRCGPDSEEKKTLKSLRENALDALLQLRQDVAVKRYFLQNFVNVANQPELLRLNNHITADQLRLRNNNRLLEEFYNLYRYGCPDDGDEVAAQEQFERDYKTIEDADYQGVLSKYVSSFLASIPGIVQGNADTIVQLTDLIGKFGFAVVLSWFHAFIKAAGGLFNDPAYR